MLYTFVYVIYVCSFSLYRYTYLYVNVIIIWMVPLTLKAFVFLDDVVRVYLYYKGSNECHANRPGM